MHVWGSNSISRCTRQANVCSIVSRSCAQYRHKLLLCYTIAHEGCVAGAQKSSGCEQLDVQWAVCSDENDELSLYSSDVAGVLSMGSFNNVLAIVSNTAMVLKLLKWQYYVHVVVTCMGTHTLGRLISSKTNACPASACAVLSQPPLVSAFGASPHQGAPGETLTRAAAGGRLIYC